MAVRPIPSCPECGAGLIVVREYRGTEIRPVLALGKPSTAPESEGEVNVTTGEQESDSYDSIDNEYVTCRTTLCSWEPDFEIGEVE